MNIVEKVAAAIIKALKKHEQEPDGNRFTNTATVGELTDDPKDFLVDGYFDITEVARAAIEASAPPVMTDIISRLGETWATLSELDNGVDEAELREIARSLPNLLTEAKEEIIRLQQQVGAEFMRAKAVLKEQDGAAP